MSEDLLQGDEWIMLSTLQHFSFCPTQAYLIREGVWHDNHFTIQGKHAHTRVDTRGTDHRRGAKIHHSVEVSSNRLRIYGVADSIEESPSGILLPVEHKHGRGIGNLKPSIIQAVAQALCLEEMLATKIPEIAIYISVEHRRELFCVDDYKTETEYTIERTRQALSGGPIPPVYDRSRCKSCSVRIACQPQGVEWI